MPGLFTIAPKFPLNSLPKDDTVFAGTSDHRQLHFTIEIGSDESASADGAMLSPKMPRAYFT